MIFPPFCKNSNLQNNGHIYRNRMSHVKLNDIRRTKIRKIKRAQKKLRNLQLHVNGLLVHNTD